MEPYNSFELREAGKRAGLNRFGFVDLLDFVEWSGFVAPRLCLQRAQGSGPAIEREFAAGEPFASHQYHECRVALESAIRYQHASGDALARLLSASLAETKPPAILYLSTFEESLPPGVIATGVMSALSDLRDSSEWLYVCAFSNTMKHMSLVDHMYYFGESPGFAFRSFEYKGDLFSERSQNEFAGIIANLQDRLARVLNSLGFHLAARASG